MTLQQRTSHFSPKIVEKTFLSPQQRLDDGTLQLWYFSNACLVYNVRIYLNLGSVLIKVSLRQKGWGKFSQTFHWFQDCLQQWWLWYHWPIIPTIHNDKTFNHTTTKFVMTVIKQWMVSQDFPGFLIWTFTMLVLCNLKHENIAQFFLNLMEPNWTGSPLNVRIEPRIKDI